MDVRREQRGWYFYDWANSAFSTTVVAVFLGPYLTVIAKAAADADGNIYPLHWLGLGQVTVYADSYWSYLVSLSVLLQVVVLPILGAIADYSHVKKQMLGLFAYIGAAATMGLFFVRGSGDDYLIGGLLFVVANVSFGAAMVFYNAFLSDIAAPDERDGVSSRGFAMGYLGGGLLLLLNLLFYTNAERFGIAPDLAARLCLLSGGIWWAGFTLIPLGTLKTRGASKALPPGAHYLTVGFRQLAHTLRTLPAFPQTLLFLAAYLLYNDGVQTVIAQLTVFGSQELKLGQDFLIKVILMVQFIAVFGALLFGWLAGRIGTKRAIILSLVVWIGCTIFAYGPLVDGRGFLALAAIGALVIGGTQALSRSVFSLMIPKGQEAEYFSVYEVSERGTSWLGPLMFGVVLQLTHSYRIGILSLVIFFVVGLVLLTRVDVRRAALEAGNEPPAHG